MPISSNGSPTLSNSQYSNYSNSNTPWTPGEPSEANPKFLTTTSTIKIGVVTFFFLAFGQTPPPPPLTLGLGSLFCHPLGTHRYLSAKTHTWICKDFSPWITWICGARLAECDLEGIEEDDKIQPGESFDWWCAVQLILWIHVDYQSKHVWCRIILHHNEPVGYWSIADVTLV